MNTVLMTLARFTFYGTDMVLCCSTFFSPSLQCLELLSVIVQQHFNPNQLFQRLKLENVRFWFQLAIGKRNGTQ